MNEAMAVGFWFTTGAVAALGVIVILYSLIRVLIEVVIGAIDARRERREEQARARLEAERKAEQEAKEREFAEKSPEGLRLTEMQDHRKLRAKHGLPPVHYPAPKPGMFDLPLDGGRYL